MSIKKTSVDTTVMFTQQDLLNMGFSRKIIEERFPKPMLRKNPRFKRSAPMKLYPGEAVNAVLASDDSSVLLAKAITKEEVSKKRERELTEQAKEYVLGLIIPAIDKKELLSAALECQLDHYEQKKCSRCGTDSEYRDWDEYIEMTNKLACAHDADKADWMLDYLLLVYTDFPRMKKHFQDKRNSGRAMCVIKRSYYMAAAKSNPYLAEACAFKLNCLTCEQGYHPEDFEEE